MKAIVRQQFGGPEQLVIEAVPTSRVRPLKPAVGRLCFVGPVSREKDGYQKMLIGLDI